MSEQELDDLVEYIISLLDESHDWWGSSPTIVVCRSDSTLNHYILWLYPKFGTS